MLGTKVLDHFENPRNHEETIHEVEIDRITISLKPSSNKWEMKIEKNRNTVDQQQLMHMLSVANYLYELLSELIFGISVHYYVHPPM